MAMTTLPTTPNLPASCRGNVPRIWRAIMRATALPHRTGARTGQASCDRPQRARNRQAQAPAAPKRGLEWGGERDRAAAPTPQTPSVPQRAERTEPPKPGRSIFAGFKPKTPTRVPGPEEGWAVGGANAPGKAPDTRDIRLGPTVQRYARAVNEVTQSRASANPELPHQREAWVKANQALDAIRLHAARISRARSKPPGR